MKKLILASIAVAATLASCEKISEVDMAITSKQSTMNFTAYASGATTKGNPVDSNTEFEGDGENGNSFMVSAYFTASADETTNTTGKYFAFSEVAYDYTSDGAWVNKDDMYWPNEAGNLYFGAYYPEDATFGSTAATATTPSYEYSDGHALGFGYTVGATVANHKDIMYAIKTLAYADTSSESAVNLHFKHALTQVGFTATADEDISVTVSSITVCNIVDNGTFSASVVTDHDTASEVADGVANNTDDGVVTSNFGKWAPATAAASSSETTNLQNYAVAMNSDSAISVGSEATTLTKADDALMLIPQALTAWTPGEDATGTGSYLAIKCTIKHAGTDIGASIIDGYVFVPFSTVGITYNDTTNTTANAWNPGYKITYNLHFGGGYTVPGVDEETDLPDPGETPDDIDEDTDPIETLRAITYTISVDEWIPVSGGTVSFGTTTTES